MNNLLIFFALPIATIIISIALQKILKCPPLVAAIIFAIFLTVTFVVGDINFLIATIAYTILSFITATLVCLICRLIEQLSNNSGRQGNRQQCTCCNNTSNLINNTNDLLTISSTCNNTDDGTLLTISSRTNDNNTSGCNCNNTNNVNGRVRANINVIPNAENNGRTGCVCGRYRSI